MKKRDVVDALNDATDAVYKNNEVIEASIDDIIYTVDWFRKEAEYFEMDLRVIELLNKKKNGTQV